MKFKVTIGKFRDASAEIKALGRRVGWLACAADPSGTGTAYAITLTERFAGVTPLKAHVASPAEAKKVLEQAVNDAWKRLTTDFAVEQRLQYMEARLETPGGLHG